MKIGGRSAVHAGILFLMLSESIHAQKPAVDDLLVLNHVTVVDVRTGTLQSEQTVILERNHIAAVGPSNSARYSGSGRSADISPTCWGPPQRCGCARGLRCGLTAEAPFERQL